MRFRDYADSWINNYAIPNLSPKTYERYKSMLRSRILPYLGNMYLDKIQPMQLMYLYQELSESTYIRKILNISYLQKLYWNITDYYILCYNKQYIGK